MSAWTYCLQDGKAAQKIAPPRPRIPWWKGPGADSEEKREPVSDIDIAVADSLKVLDLKRPIREADIRSVRWRVADGPCADSCNAANSIISRHHIVSAMKGRLR